MTTGTVQLVWLVGSIQLSAMVVATTGCRDFGYYDGRPGQGLFCQAAEPEEVEFETCGEEIPAATSGLCDITPGSGSTVLFRGEVLGRDKVYRNGSVLIDGKAIVCAGCDCADHPGYTEATRFDCAEAVISPGLINPHDHLSFNEAAPLDTGGDRYEHRHQWREELATPGNAHGNGVNSTGMRWVEMRQVFAGTTSVVGAGRAEGMMRNLDRLNTDDPGRCIDDAGTICLDEVEPETFPLGDGNRVARANCDWNYSFGEIEVAAMAAYIPHVAEGIDDLAQEEFRCQSTSFDGGQDHTEKNTAHIHGVGLTTADYYNMARDGAKLIWSARTNISLYGNTAQVSTFSRLGGVVALGTDWTYSGSMNMLRELACADEWNRFYLGGFYSTRELWDMATINAAIATGSDALLGSLEADKFADVAIFARRDQEDPYRAVIEADNADVALVLKAGSPLYGRADLVAALDGTCDAVEVCGEAQAICTTREYGAGYSDIAADAATSPAAYPLFFCGVPDGEPTCAPSRPGEYTGLPSGLDGDGDGVLDASDNCPCLFNPVRPIDRDGQPDLDGDGLGDPCDPDPLVADLDSDARINRADNCPFVANADQTDTDDDGKGDACDFCPGIANPDSVCPSPGIRGIQEGLVAEGTRLSVRGVVTSATDSSITIQDPDGDDPQYSGIFAFTGSGHGLVIGDLVDVVGEVDEFFGLTELTGGVTATRVGSSTPIEPAVVTIAEAASEPYEGVLVCINDIDDVVPSYNCRNDNSSCNDSNLWEVNGPSGSVVVYDLMWQGSSAEWTSEIGSTSVCGVMHYRYDRRRILPRTAADFDS